MSKKNPFFVGIPSIEQEQDAVLKSAINRLPQPEELDGLKHKERKVLRTDQPIKTDKNGNTLNPTRVSGTGSRDQSLTGSFEKGIDVRELPPKVLKINEGLQLFGGFGRSLIFEELNYKFWIYDVYEDDAIGRNELQSNASEALEDASISDNGSFKSKPAVKDDYVRILVKRISSQKWDDEKCIQWFDTIEHCLKAPQIKEYIASAKLRNKADGVIEDVKVGTASKIASDYDPTLNVLNVTDTENNNWQRFLRTLPGLMNGYINSKGKTQEFAAFHTATPSHNAIDESIAKGQVVIDDVLDLITRFENARRFYETTPCRLSKVVYQKIGGEHQVKTLVDIKDYDWEGDK